MLRVDDSPSVLTARLMGAIDRGIDYAAGFRGLGRYLMPQLRVTGLALPITPLLPGNADLASNLYRNRFILAGADLSGGTTSIFTATPPSEPWARELHGFGWLIHLAGGGLEMHRAFARTLIADWTARRHPRIAHALPVRARRLKAAVLAAPLLLAGSAQSFRDPFFRMMSRDATVLSVTSPPGDERLGAALALAYAATSLEGLEGLRAGAFERLEAALSAEILPDGGHLSRNPAALADLLIDLLPLRTTLGAAHQMLPRAFNGAIERMLPMLRFFAHGDDGLAAFQGVSAPMTRELRTVLGQDSTLGRPLSHAPHSGYARLVQGSALVIADIGNDALCASPLAFEFSDGPSRIVVNCGLPSSASGKWFAAARQQAAHSTATAIEAEASAASGPFERWFRQQTRLPRPRTTGRVTQSEHGLLLRAIDHAFAGRPGDLHERDIFLSASGNDLRGEDRFLAGERQSEIGERAAAVRFHLHPAVKATLSQDGLSVMLILANKAGWRFSAKGGALSLEDSVYLLGSGAPRNTQQIVIRGKGQINWAFKRIEKRSKAKDETEAPELPL
jgi:uncharacterized heparinase superfamily protein